MEIVELLKQNLAIEPDLQNFVAFILDAVKKLGGSAFAASGPSLALMNKLRSEGAATGYPLCTRLNLEGTRLFAAWEGHEAEIATLGCLPDEKTLAQLRRHLRDSTVADDPDVLLQRNAEMARYLEETRAQADLEMEALRQALEKHQNRLYESLRQAETDPLTGLLNRRAFDEKLERAFRRTMRQKYPPLSLLLLDLDHFKQINDEFGHQHGDNHLVRTAETLRSVIREDVDFAFRIGGDEFAILVFADIELAFDKGKQVLLLSENRMSIGIATIRQDTPEDLTPEEFIHCADDALYEAKRLGRGRTVVGRFRKTNQNHCAT